LRWIELAKVDQTFERLSKRLDGKREILDYMS